MTTLFPANDFDTSAHNFLLPGRDATLNPSSLTEAVRDAMQEIEENRLRPLAGPVPTIPPKVLLALLAFCYAREVYGSQRIAKCVARNRTFRALCGSRLPDARAIREFRDYNRAALQRCLTTILRFLARARIAAAALLPASEIFVADEAKRRIIMATCIDRLELENGN